MVKQRICRLKVELDISFVFARFASQISSKEFVNLRNFIRSRKLTNSLGN